MGSRTGASRALVSREACGRYCCLPTKHIFPSSSLSTELPFHWGSSASGKDLVSPGPLHVGRVRLGASWHTEQSVCRCDLRVSGEAQSLLSRFPLFLFARLEVEQPSYHRKWQTWGWKWQVQEGREWRSGELGCWHRGGVAGAAQGIRFLRKWTLFRNAPVVRFSVTGCWMPSLLIQGPWGQEVSSCPRSQCGPELRAESRSA